MNGQPSFLVDTTALWPPHSCGTGADELGYLTKWERQGLVLLPQAEARRARDVPNGCTGSYSVQITVCSELELGKSHFAV